MSRQISTSLQRIAAVTSIAVLCGIALSTGAVHAGQGPICEDNEEPVCEEPPPPPPSNQFNPSIGYVTVIPVEDTGVLSVQPCSSRADCTLTMPR